MDNYVAIHFYDYDDDGSRDYGGSIEVSFRELLFNRSQFAIINKTKL